MLTDNELMVTFKAIELMSYGIDISDYDLDKIKSTFVKKDGGIISICNSNVPNWIAKLTEDAKDSLDIFSNYIIREHRTYRSKNSLEEDLKENTVVNAEILLQTIRILYNNKVLNFYSIPPELLDEELMQRINDDRVNFNRKEHQPEEFIKGLSKDSVETPFKVLTTVIYGKCEKEIVKMVADAYKKDIKHFDIAGYEDFPVIDNRLFIPISESDMFDLMKELKTQGINQLPEEWRGLKYVVISKNPYDYYFASYGSMIQSCYSLNSSHLGLFGVVPMSDIDGHYIVYGTKDKPYQFNLFADGMGKINVPYMYFRAWGYTEEGSKEFLMDKLYKRSDGISERIVNALKITVFRNMKLNKSFDNYAHEVYNGDALRKYHREADLRFYPDSLRRTDDGFDFRYDRGDKSFIGNICWQDLNQQWCDPAQVMKTISKIDDGLSIDKPFVITDGCFTNLKLCPVTSLPITSKESKHRYAKYYNSHVDNTAVLTYIDGSVAVTDLTKKCVTGSLRVTEETNQLSTLDYLTKLYSKPMTISLQGLKNKLKSSVEGSCYDVILLRVVEGDKVEFIKYKKKGVF